MPFDPLDRHVTDALNAWRVQEGAGVALEKSLITASRSCFSPTAQACFEEAAKRAADGAQPVKLLKAFEHILPPAERAVLAAGFRAGQIDRILGYLVAKREMWHAARARIRAKMVLPIALLVAAALIAPLPNLILGGSPIVYVLCAGIPLSVAFVVWRLVAGLIRARQFSGGAGENPAPESSVDRVLMAVPFLSRLERLNNLCDFTNVLGHLIAAGMLLSEALDVCARVLPNGRYRVAAEVLAKDVRSHTPLADAMSRSPIWPHELIAGIATGEQTGTLEEACVRLSNGYREEYQRSIEQVADWIPRLVYVLIALFIIAGIIVLVLSLVGTYGQLLDS